MSDPLTALKEIKRICEGDSEGEHGYTGSELAEVILGIANPTLAEIELEEEVRLALYLSSVWDPENADDVAAAREAVAAFRAGEPGP